MNKIPSLLIIFLFIQCAKNEVIEIPLANANFDVEVDGRLLKDWGDITVSSFDTIKFINTSTDAHHYIWEIEKGVQSASESVSHVFKSQGTYEVNLKAFNSEDKLSEHKIKINVGYRILTELYVEKIEKNNFGNGLLYFGEIDNPENEYVISIPWIERNDLPFGSSVNFGKEVVLSDKEWFWVFVQNYPPHEWIDENDKFLWGALVNPARAKGGEYGILDEITILEGENVEGKASQDYGLRIGYKIVL